VLPRENIPEEVRWADRPPRKNTVTELRNSARKNRGAGVELQ